jgi:hypothetical protein
MLPGAADGFLAESGEPSAERGFSSFGQLVCVAFHLVGIVAGIESHPLEHVELGVFRPGQCLVGRGLGM